MKIRRRLAAIGTGLAIAAGGAVVTATPAAAHATCRTHSHQIGPYIYTYGLSQTSSNGGGGICYSRVTRYNVITHSMVYLGVRSTGYIGF